MIKKLGGFVTYFEMGNKNKNRKGMLFLSWNDMMGLKGFVICFVKRVVMCFGVWNFKNYKVASTTLCSQVLDHLDLPKSGGAMAPSAPPGTTPLYRAFPLVVSNDSVPTIELPKSLKWMHIWFWRLIKRVVDNSWQLCFLFDAVLLDLQYKV